MIARLKFPSLMPAPALRLWLRLSPYTRYMLAAFALAVCGVLYLGSKRETLFLPAVATGGLLTAWIIAARPDLWVGPVFAFAIFVPLLKPLTGRPEFMLLPDLAMYALAAGVIARGGRGRWTNWSFGALVAWLVFYTVAFLQVKNPNVPDFRTGLEGLRKTAFTSIGVWVGMNAFRDSTELRRALRWMAVAALVAALYGVKQRFFWSSFDTKIVQMTSAGVYTARLGGKARAIAFFSGPFHLGTLGVQMFCLGAIWNRLRPEGSISWGRMLLKPFSPASLDQTLGFLLMALGAAATISSRTRTNYLALAALGVVFWALAARTYPLLLTRISVAGLIVALGVPYLYVNDSPELRRFTRNLLNPMADSRFVNRYTELIPALNSVRERPFMAYGVGAAGDALSDAYGRHRIHYTTHNLGLKLLVELGVIGFLGFAVLMGLWATRALLSMLRSRGDPSRFATAAYSAALVTPVLFNGLVNSGIEVYPMNLFFWLGVGVVFPEMIRGTTREA